MKIFTWKQRVIVWMTSICSILILGGIGYLLDKIIHTRNIFFIIGILGSFPVNAYFIRKNIIKYGIEK